MRAYITSIGEPTTDLCKWSVERNGYEAVIVDGDSSLAQKLQWIYNEVEDDFLRIDADVICNRNLNRKLTPGKGYIWWIQYMTYDWYNQDAMYGGVQFVKKHALPTLRKNIQDHITAERPESQMFRLPAFHEPRRCESSQTIMGIHGYKQTDVDRVRQTKQRRGQDYDWELFERIQAL